MEDSKNEFWLFVKSLIIAFVMVLIIMLLVFFSAIGYVKKDIHTTYKPTEAITVVQKQSE